MAEANQIAAMRIGYEVLSSMIDMVIGNKTLLAEMQQLQPDLIIGDAVASYGHWLTWLLDVPSVEFDVGTSSGILHSLGFGGQLNPAYVPAPGGCHKGVGGWVGVTTR